MWSNHNDHSFYTLRIIVLICSSANLHSINWVHIEIHFVTNSDAAELFGRSSISNRYTLLIIGTTSKAFFIWSNHKIRISFRIIESSVQLYFLMTIYSIHYRNKKMEKDI